MKKLISSLFILMMFSCYTAPVMADEWKPHQVIMIDAMCFTEEYADKWIEGHSKSYQMGHGLFTTFVVNGTCAADDIYQPASLDKMVRSVTAEGKTFELWEVWINRGEYNNIRVWSILPSVQDHRSVTQ